MTSTNFVTGSGPIPIQLTSRTGPLVSTPSNGGSKPKTPKAPDPAPPPARAPASEGNAVSNMERNKARQRQGLNSTRLAGVLGGDQGGRQTLG